MACIAVESPSTPLKHYIMGYILPQGPGSLCFLVMKFCSLLSGQHIHFSALPVPNCYLSSKFIEFICHEPALTCLPKALRTIPTLLFLCVNESLWTSQIYPHHWMEFLMFNVTKPGRMLAPARSATSSVLLWDVKGIYKSGGEACLLPQHDKVWHEACV